MPYYPRWIQFHGAIGGLGWVGTSWYGAPCGTDDNVMPFDDDNTMTVQCNAVCGLDNLMIIIR